MTAMERAAVNRLLGDAADSPVVANSTQITGGLFLAHQF